MSNAVLSPTIPAASDFSTFAGALDSPPEFLEMLPVAAYACDADGHVLWFNARAADLWGRAPRIGDDSELFCGSHKAFLGSRLITRAETPMAAVLRTGDPVMMQEAVLERPDGSRIWVMVNIQPVKDVEGTVIGAVNCFQETTEFHRAADNLHRKQQDLEDFFENGAVALHLVSGEGKILRANRAELDLLGYGADEYIGHHIAEFHADEDRISDIMCRLQDGQKLDKYPARLRAKDGSIKHVLITSNVQYREGEFLNTRCFTIDVTDSKAAQEQIQETERRSKQLLDALPVAVYTTDANGVITYYNAAAADVAGRTPVPGTDRWCVTWRLQRPDGAQLPHEECPMAITLATGKPVRNVEAVAERPDGTRIPVIPHPTPLFDSSGTLTGAVNVLVDISGRKQAETQQRILLNELNHRVKNNMQMLYSLLLGAQRETTNAEARAVLADASQRVAAMAAAQQVLYGSDNTADFDAREFLDIVCASIRQILPKGVSIVCGPTSGRLSNDVGMPLALILNELLTNAAKHGIGPEGVIKVGLAKLDGSFQLYVEDDGPGFDLGAIRRRSSGLGLVIGLARQLGGKFEVQRTRGARCIVYFSES
jgi:PAS domain S-box-containing protein